MTKDYGNYVYLASSPGPTQKLGKGPAKISVCAVSAVFLWSRGTQGSHSSIANYYILDVKIVDLFQDHLKMGTRLADFHKPNFRNLKRIYAC